MSKPGAPVPQRVLVLNWRDTGHPEGGGSEVYVEQVADGLARQGRDVTLVCARYAGAARSELRASGVRVVRIGGRLTLYPLVVLAYFLGRLGRPDTIIEVQNGMPFLARLWARRAQVVVLVHHVHREQWRVVMPAPLARIGWWLESRVAPRVNRGCRYVAVSETTKRELGQLGVDTERISVVHNGTPPRQGPVVPRAERPELLVVGRLVPHKRVELAVDVLAELIDRIPDLTLVVAGRGWWEDELHAHVEQRGLTGRVRFAGHVSEQEKSRLYQRAWVSLVPSLKEGWGLIVVEAGTYATPSVAFRIAGGVVESIRDGETGLLADDPAAFTECVARFLDDEKLRLHLGQAAREYAAGFTWAGTVLGFTAVLDRTQGSADRGAGVHVPVRGGSGTRPVLHDGRLDLLGRRLRSTVDADTRQTGQNGGGQRRQRDSHPVLPDSNSMRAGQPGSAGASPRVSHTVRDAGSDSPSPQP